MRSLCWLALLLAVACADPTTANDAPRRTTHVASTPVTAPSPAEPQRAPLAVKPAVPSPTIRGATLLEPGAGTDGVDRNAVVCFQVPSQPAALWQLVVHEVDGPVAQIFEGEGQPPRQIPWDGRLLDGGLAWAGLGYTYYVAAVDSSGEVTETAGADFALPAYTLRDRRGISFLMTGDRLNGGADPAAALRPVAAQLDRESPAAAVRIEVLARTESEALALGKAVQTTLLELLASGGRNVDLYVGEAAAAPATGTVLITTVPLPAPSS